jgi:hypothetical protein
MYDFLVDPTGIVHTKFHPNSFRNSWLESEEQTDIYGQLYMRSFHAHRIRSKRTELRRVELDDRK